ncbi:MULTISPECIES: SDR family oxidoreductase [Acetobacteraceae]|uniref:Putative oxidoreductase n=1 Tax=Acetobacter senegalensis TaxID=446692 RepID=A0A0U5EUP5_9PROT|nr:MULTISPECIES: SDR family oxidoreductase [Acetobacteraceae]MCG4261927.1 SDR family oxidoreductase [Acetobacter senegalensis]CEF41435.1 putative oxidoreductase [Acetobacter senegalensis]
MTDNIKGKVVAITGASSGIGEATARRLGQAGAKIVLGARRFERLERIAADIILTGGEALAVDLDVMDRGSVDAFAETAISKFGALDILVNNAGVMLLSPLAEVKVDEWDRMIDVNIKGVLYGIGAALPIMQRQGRGHIVNVSSVAGHRVGPGSAVYSGTKFAVRAISEGFRQEAGPAIRSTIISPGAVTTELPNHITDAKIAEAAKAMYSTAIDADAIARAIEYAVTQPANVDVNEILIRPTAQQS